MLCQVQSVVAYIGGPPRPMTAQDEKNFRRVLCLWMWGSSGDVVWTWLTARFP